MRRLDLYQPELGASPKVDDCWRLHDNIAGDGTWTVSGWVQRTLATYGTCAVGVQSGTLELFKVGNGDIRALMRDSIQKFGGAGVVGAAGRMECQVVGVGTTTVYWGIYHT
ncbi:hypothetical protein N657DRAFT_646748 [Parathielavia appendiculata]|uniref:Ecp2 effector protein-like domain-containing protein n=1 Tax=Parathielavia appendiculata TaxID=2587402 RepID=A0AAN6TXK9_9PEZI|nr:hypothetical protein N657DRAFT_646748 [Parathielavia appendiculata]